jgi:hypothetical protein
MGERSWGGLTKRGVNKIDKNKVSQENEIN